jgi:hypothetical protein
LELAQSQRTLQIAQPVVVTEIDHVIEPRTLLIAAEMISADAVIAKAAHAVGGFKAGRGNNAALTRGHGFDRVQTENVEIGQLADGDTAIAGTEGMARICH